jgi:PAS domain S-box-containing protein
MEAMRALLVGGLFVYLLSGGRHGGLRRLPGWLAVLTGLGLLCFAMALDVTDNFPQLNRFLVIGDTTTAAFLEKFVGYLPGMGLLVLGVSRLIPALQKLHLTYEKLGITLDSMGDAVIVTDAQGGVVRMNQVAEELTGWVLPEVAGCPVEHVFVQAPGGEPSTSPVRQVLAGGTRVGSPATVITRSGDRCRVAVTAAPMRARDGDMIGVVQVFRDVTKECCVSEALLASAEQYRRLVETAPLGVHVYHLAPDGRLLFDGANPAAGRLLGVTNGHFSGKTFEEAFPPLARTDIPERFRRVARDGEMWHAAGVRYEYGDVAGVFAVHAFQIVPGRMAVLFEEITERLRVEEQQQQMQKMEAVGRLAGGVAHDFNNQLGGIMGAAELLDLELTDQEQRLYLSQILQAAGRASELTQQLLSFARKGTVRWVNVDMHALIGEVVAILERNLDKRITVTRRLLAATHHVQGDPAQLQNMLLNLAWNARDAMPDGGDLGFATAVEEWPAGRLPSEMPPGRYLKISVSDAGLGLTAEARKHLFEPFFTTKPNGKGTGLGLAAVYGTVTSHHGEIQVESRPVQGTFFHIYLPVIEVADEGEAVRAPDVAVAGQGRVLLVDDESIIRGVGEQMLQSLGYEVVTAVDGAAAVTYYQRHWQQVDLILLDMIMPKLGGRDTYRALKKINPTLRVLLFSGYSLDNEAQMVLDEGALGFIQKPLRRVELSQRVAAAIKPQELRP